MILARAVGVPVGQRSGGRLATTLMAITINVIIFSFFLIEGALGLKNLFSESCLECPKNLGVDIFPDPVGHSGAHWRPFYIFQAVRRCRR